MVLQCLWTDSSAKRLRPSGRWYEARPELDLPSLEGIRHQLECRWRLWRDRRF